MELTIAQLAQQNPSWRVRRYARLAEATAGKPKRRPLRRACRFRTGRHATRCSLSPAEQSSPPLPIHLPHPKLRERQIPLKEPAISAVAGHRAVGAAYDASTRVPVLMFIRRDGVADLGTLLVSSSRSSCTHLICFRISFLTWDVCAPLT
jgi:hypothetical protein